MRRWGSTGVVATGLGDGSPQLSPSSDSLPEHIYREVHELIANGKFDPANKLTETQLGPALGISRTPLREVPTQLPDDGLMSSDGAGHRLGAHHARRTRRDRLTTRRHLPQPSSRATIAACIQKQLYFFRF